MCVQAAIRRMIAICGLNRPTVFIEDLRWFINLTTVDSQVILLGTLTRKKARNIQHIINSVSRERNLNLKVSPITKGYDIRFTDKNKLYNLEDGYHLHLLNDGVLVHGKFCIPSTAIIPEEFWA